MSRYRDQGPLDCKVYVGGLGSDASKQELEEAFRYYGPLRSVWVAHNPPGFAFIEFEDSRDAEDAVRALDGRTLCGRRVRVELSSGRNKRRFRGGGPPHHDRSSRPQMRCYDCGDWGHFARDCQRYGRRGGRKSRSRSRSRSPSRTRKSKSRSRSRDRSRSRNRSHTRSRSSSRSVSRSRSPSRSPKRTNQSSSPSTSKQNGND